LKGGAVSMEEFISELFKSQGVWAALFVFFLLYTIRRNDKLDESQCEREREYQKMLLELTKMLQEDKEKEE
jgi:hypothetical protein